MSERAVIGSHDPSYVSANWQSVMSEWQRAERLVPITGAGIGINFGLPDWLSLADLLCDVLCDLQVPEASAIRGERDVLVKVFRATHHLQTRARRSDAVRNQIRSSLYSKLRVDVAGVWWLECVYQIAISSSMHITLNFDDLLETYSDVAHPDNRIIPVLLSRAPRRKQGQIDSYHAHGMLSRDARRDTGSGPLVFDLVSYIEQYEHYIDQMSVAILHACANYRCIFLGLSMIDPNLLRLIKTARRIRNDGSCWGMVFGHIVFELQEILDALGLACVSIPLGDPADHSLIPQEILRSLPLTDEVNINDKCERLKDHLFPQLRGPGAQLVIAGQNHQIPSTMP